jgi:hypothetical protein
MNYIRLRSDAGAGLWRSRGIGERGDLHSFFIPQAFSPRSLLPEYSTIGVVKMKSFSKHPSCPTSEEILSYVNGSISRLIRPTVERHARRCDFCGGEMQLLAKYKSSKKRYAPAPVPALIGMQGVNLPAVRHAQVQHARAA